MKGTKKKELTEEDLITYGIYSKGLESIRHFDSLQSISETEVSRIVRYALIAVGILLTLKISSNLTLLFCICIGAGCMLFVFSRLLKHSINEERFLVSNFADLIELEEKYKWLPAIFHSMIQKTGQSKKKMKIGHHGSVDKKTILYIFYLFIPFFFFIVFPVVFVKFSDSWFNAIVVIGCSAIGFLLFSWALIRFVGTSIQLLNKIRSGNDR